MWHFSTQGDVSRFASGSPVKVYVASINKNNFKDLVDVALSRLCLPRSLCSEGGPDTLTRGTTTMQEWCDPPEDPRHNLEQ